MRPIGVEATTADDGRQIRTDEMDIGTTDTRDRTETDIGTTDTRGRVEMAREVVGMKEEIGTGNDEMGRADGLSAGEMRESSATSRGGGTTEGTDAMSHEGDMTRGTAGMIRKGGMSKEGLEETAATIRAVGMREGDMASHHNHIPNGLGDVSMFPSMKENVEARRVKPSKEKEPIRSQSIKITFEGDMATTPIRVAATKSARGSTSKKTDTDYVMAEKDEQRVDGEEVILSPRKRKRGVKKFLMKSSLDEIDTVEPLRRALRQPMQCSILEYLAASKPALTIERPDGSQILSIRKPDGTRVMIETVEPRDPRNRAALTVGARPSNQIKSLPISGCAVRFREKKYGPLLTEEEGRIVEVENLGRLIVDGNSYPKEKDEEFGGVVSKEKEEAIAFMKEKMVSHVAEPSDSAYANRWFFLRKPNGKIRWIQDLHKVNAVTIRDVGSVPHADLLAEGTAGRLIYSVCDLFSGYDEVPLDPRDRHLTAMHMPLGLIQMMVVPMGWTNGVAVFQRAIVAVLKDFIPDKVEVFLDDLPIKRPVNKDEAEVAPGVRRFVEKHLTDICAVLEQLDNANLTVSGTKSRWAVSTIKILGFICDSRGHRVDPAKLDKLLNCPSPLHSPTEVRQFLGVVGYWRIFIRRYAEKAEPLRLLLRKTEKFYWDSSQELAMQELKDEFKEEGRVLGVSYFDDEAGRPFIVATDAGPCSVGGLLSQKDAEGKEKPLRFESRTLNTVERNYSQFKKEVLAVLRYPTIARWLIRIRLYDYTVERISGTKNVVADELSRIPLEGERPIVAGALTMAEPRHAERFLVNLYEGKYRTIGLYLTGEESQDSDIRRQAAQYCLRASHLFRRPVGSGMPLRVVCDPEERQTIVAELHDGVVGGHRGVKGTYEKIRRLYWWEGQYKDVERYCMTCEECQKRALVKYKEPLHPSYPTPPGEKIHIDLVKMPKGVGNMNDVVNIRDDFTGFVDGRPIRSKTAKEVKNFVLEYLSRYGCVRKIVMDRGAEFLAAEV
ncbi:hypothetical protein CBR_g4297 [Chara braunii]|uniref:Integrase catalytic domain-containing protein n=1 Tax=Chara braunii TaxID=69332 RepID=A0A388JRC6_CHABU|nr:hypothetical protein CBR_g4297 [Chara braunii]|eukprot:GBG60341.1 hypothetical protein CBR_g4297 [Chara braunii]